MEPGHDQARAAFQAELDALSDGAALQLLPREFPGPVWLRRAATLDGQGATLWAMQGPVLVVESDRATLRNLRIECTGEQFANPQESCALWIACRKISLENVEVRGNVVGLPEEEGEWRYPTSVHLGALLHGMEHRLLLRLAVPVPCRLQSEIAGVELEPSSLSAGTHEIQLAVERLPQDTFLCGTISISTAFLKRRIMLSAHVLAAKPDLPEPSREQNRLIWEPADWSSLGATGSRPSQVLVPPTPPPPLPTAVVPPAPRTMLATPSPAASAPAAPPPVVSAAPAPPPVVSAPPAPPPAPAVAPRPVPAPPAVAASAPPPVTSPPLVQPTAKPPSATPAPPLRQSTLKRVSSPLGKLFSPPQTQAPEPPAESLPEVPSSATLSPLFTGGSAAAAPPTTPSPALGSDPVLPPVSPSPALPRSSRRSVPLRPASSLFSPPAAAPPAVAPPAVAPPATPPTQEAPPSTGPEPPAPPANNQAGAPPAKKKFKPASLPALFTTPKPNPENKPKDTE